MGGHDISVTWGATGILDVKTVRFDRARRCQIERVLTGYDIAAPPAFFESLECAISLFQSGRKLTHGTRPAAVRKNLKNAIRAGQLLYRMLLNFDDGAKCLLRQAASGIEPEHIKKSRSVRALRSARDGAIRLNDRLDDLDGKSKQLLDRVVRSFDPRQSVVGTLCHHVGTVTSALGAAVRLGISAGQGERVVAKDSSRLNHEGATILDRLQIDVSLVIFALQRALARSREEYPSKPTGALPQNHRVFLALDLADTIRTHLGREPTQTKEGLFMEILELVLAAATGKEENSVHELAREALTRASRIGGQGGLIEYLRHKG